MEDQTQIRDQIQRCRRLARNINDESARNSLEQLAQDYEGQLHSRSDNGDDASLDAP